MNNIFGNVMIITNDKEKWVSLLQKNIDIKDGIAEGDYIVIYTELGNIIISNTVFNQTPHYINRWIIDKEIEAFDFILFSDKDYIFTEDGQIIKLENEKE